MCDRKNTLVCVFDMSSPRISAYHIHEWIHDNLRLEEDDIRTLQIDGPRRRVYIKFNSEFRLQQILHDTNGQLDFHHDNGELSKVIIELADVGLKNVRLARLPPEVPEDIIKNCLSKYGEVRNIRDEMWTQAYRYKVYNGVRIVEIKIKQHLPSHLLIAGHDSLISYDGQPPTCYRCNAIGHLQQDCPRRRVAGLLAQNAQTSTWADIVAHSDMNRQHTMDTSSIPQTHNMRIEGPDTADKKQVQECTDSQSNEMYHEMTPVNELDHPNHSTDNDHVLVNAGILPMESLNAEETNDNLPSIHPRVQPAQQVPSRPQIRPLTLDTADHVPQTDKHRYPTEQGEYNPSQSDEEPPQSQTLGSSKKKKIQTRT